MNKDDGRRRRSAFGRYRQPVSQPDERHQNLDPRLAFLCCPPSPPSPFSPRFRFSANLVLVDSTKVWSVAAVPSLPYSLLDGLYCMQQKAFHPGGPTTLQRDMKAGDFFGLVKMDN